MRNLPLNQLALLAAFSIFLVVDSIAQTPSFPSSTFPVNGTVDKHLIRTVLEHATIHVDSKTVIEDGTIVLFRGLIEKVGPSAEISVTGPAIRHDMSDYHLYPSFVDLNSDYGLPDVKPSEWSRTPQYESNTKGAFGWNQAVRPEINSSKVFVEDKSEAKALREAGIGAVLTHVPDGIVRGTGVLVMPVDDPRDAILRSEASAHYSFRKGTSGQSYPSSLMGSTALLRQTHLDAIWYAEASPRGLAGGTNLSLEAFNEAQDLPQIFSSGTWRDILRATDLGEEFGIEYTVLGGGDSYQRAEAIAATGATVIVPLDYPTAYDLSDPHLARFVSLTELKHWELAPSNASILHSAGVQFCFTSSGLKSPSKLLPAVKKAVKRGLPAHVALEALTSVPASTISATDLVGSLNPGTMANLIVMDGPMFDDKSKMVEHWVSGDPTILIDRHAVDLSGTYNLTVGTSAMDLLVGGSTGKWKATEVVNDSTKNKVDLSLDGRTVVMALKKDEGVLRLTGNVWMDSRIWEGSASMPTGIS
jgi:hypothetical protein